MSLFEVHTRCGALASKIYVFVYGSCLLASEHTGNHAVRISRNSRVGQDIIKLRDSGDARNCFDEYIEHTDVFLGDVSDHLCNQMHCTGRVCDLYTGHAGPHVTLLPPFARVVVWEAFEGTKEEEQAMLYRAQLMGL